MKVFTLSLILLVFLPALAAKTIRYDSRDFSCTIPNDLALSQSRANSGYSRTPLLGSYHKGRFNSVSNPLYVVMFFGADQAVTTAQPMPGKQFVAQQPFTDISSVTPMEFKWRGSINGLRARYMGQRTSNGTIYPLYAYGAVLPLKSGGIWVFVAAAPSEDARAKVLLQKILDSALGERKQIVTADSASSSAPKEDNSFSILPLLGLVAVVAIMIVIAVVIFVARQKSTPKYSMAQMPPSPYGTPQGQQPIPDSHQSGQPPPDVVALPEQKGMNAAEKAPWEM